MKFSVSKDKLLEGLSTVQNVVSTRTTLPILSNVLLQASEGEIRLTTTDLDVGVRGSVEAHVERTGGTTIPARRLFSIVRELPSSEIYFDVDTKNSASIRSGSSYFKILGLPEEEFPALARFEEAKIFTIAQKDLKDGLKKTSYAISVDGTRYVLNGILFSFKDNKLTLVATDGRRLALVDLELEFPRSQETLRFEGRFLSCILHTYMYIKLHQKLAWVLICEETRRNLRRSQRDSRFEIQSNPSTPKHENQIRRVSAPDRRVSEAIRERKDSLEKGEPFSHQKPASETLKDRRNAH